MQINPSEVTKILKEQIKKFGENAEVSEVGQVLSVGDGIARIYGLTNVQSGELVEFENGLKAIVLNLEEDNVGVVLLGPSKGIKEGDIVKRNSKKGEFYGCSNYPKCNFISKYRPVNKKCPECGYLMAKRTYRKKDVYECIKCKYREEV